MQHEPPRLLGLLARGGVVRLPPALDGLLVEIAEYLTPEQAVQDVAGDAVPVERSEQRREGGLSGGAIGGPAQAAPDDRIH